MDKQAFNKALETIWKQVADTNVYFANAAPWGLKNSDPERMGTILYVAAEAVRQLAILIQPITPDATDILLTQMSIDEESRSFAHLGPDHRLQAGSTIPKPQGVFPRFQPLEDS